MKFVKLEKFWKSHGSDILFGTGVVASIAGLITCAMATSKAKDALDDRKKEVETAKKAIESKELVDAEVDIKKVEKSANIRAAKRIVTSFAIPVALEATSLLCFTKSRGILKKENLGLIAANAITMRSFDNYRKRTIEKFGEDVDKELYYGYKEIEVEKEDGTVTKEVVREDSCEYEYEFFFDATSKLWSKDPYANKATLKRIQKNLNRDLMTNGYIFVNDVKEACGLPKEERTQAGQVVGWVYDPESTNNNFIDFGFWDGDDEASARFLEGYEAVVRIRLRPQGVIIDKLDGLMMKI